MAHIESNGLKHVARVHRRGYPTYSKTFDSLRKAQAWAREIETQLDNGNTPQKTKKGVTVGDIFKDYIENHSLDWREKGRFLQVQEDLKAYNLETLTKTRIKKYLATLKLTPVPDKRKVENRTSATAHRHKLYNGAKVKTYSDSSIRKYFYTLKKVLTWHAEKNGYNFDTARFAGIDVPSGWTNDRDRRLSNDGKELKALLLACHHMANHGTAWNNLILLAIETAMRAQELVKAKFDDLSTDGKVLDIKPANEKTKKGRTVLLSKVARQLIASQRAEDKVFIFEEFKQDPRAMTKLFRLLCHKAGVDEFHFHDLRHEAVSLLCEKNVLSMPEVMAMTGHTTFTTFRRYAKFFNTNKADLL